MALRHPGLKCRHCRHRSRAQVLCCVRAVHLGRDHRAVADHPTEVTYRKHHRGHDAHPLGRAELGRTLANAPGTQITHTNLVHHQCSHTTTSHAQVSTTATWQRPRPNQEGRIMKAIPTQEAPHGARRVTGSAIHQLTHTSDRHHLIPRVITPHRPKSSRTTHGRCSPSLSQANSLLITRYTNETSTLAKYCYNRSPPATFHYATWTLNTERVDHPNSKSDLMPGSAECDTNHIRLVHYVDGVTTWASYRTGFAK